MKANSSRYTILHYFMRPDIFIVSFILCAFAGTNVTFPQSQKEDHGVIEGRIYNASDSSALAGATVMLMNTVLGSSTDINGKFKILNVPVGDHTLSVSMLGFQRQRIGVHIEAQKTKIISFALHETALQSDEIVVTASKRQQSLEEVPVSISFMEGRDIEKRTLVSLDQALRYIPGVNMTESQVNIRGSSGYSRAFGTRVLILIDGFSLLSGDSGEIKYDAIPMYSIDRIEVVKGAGSALYGSSALGGVINVITKTPKENYWQARVYSGMYDKPAYPEWKWWSNGMRVFNGVDIQRGGTIDKFSYLMSGGIRNNRGYRLLDDDKRWNINAKAWYELSSLSNLNVAVNYTDDNRGNWIYWRDLKNALIPPLTADLTEKIVSTKFQTTAQYRQTLDDNFAYVLKANYYRTYFDTHSDTSDYQYRPLARGESNAQLFGVEWQGNLFFSQKHFLTFGVDGNYSLVNSFTYGDKNGKAIALYAQDDYKIFNECNVSIGLRGDITKIDISKTDGQLNPRLGIAYSMSPITTFRASFGTGFRAASIAEKYAAASGGTVTVKPNPNLESERSVSFEVGVKQQINSIANIDVALFQSNYDNLVEPAFDSTDGRIFFANISRARIQGFEIGIQSSWFDKLLSLNFAYTYIYPRDLNLNKILKYRPRHLFYVQGAVEYNHLQFETDFRYISRMEEIDDVIGLLVHDADKRVETLVTDVRLSYDFLSMMLPLRMTVSVNNLFNYNYVEIVGNLAPIRNYTLTLETRF